MHVTPRSGQPCDGQLCTFCTKCDRCAYKSNPYNGIVKHGAHVYAEPEPPAPAVAAKPKRGAKVRA